MLKSDFLLSLFNSDVLENISQICQEELINSESDFITREQFAKRLNLLAETQSLSNAERAKLEKSSPEEYKSLREKELQNSYYLTLISTMVNLDLIDGCKWQAGAKPGIISSSKDQEKKVKVREISQEFISEVLSFLKENSAPNRAITKDNVILGLKCENPMQALKDLSYCLQQKMLPGWKGKQGKNGGIVKEES